jgi:ubiquinone/menaquinone biosynthesis C-methylase UbiE
LKDNTGRKSVFDLIAPVYGLFFTHQKKHFRSVLLAVQEKIDLSSCKTVIDIGCGTGALCAVLQENGHVVTGVDPAGEMLKIASRKKDNRGVRFLQASALERLPFGDRHFDIAIASFVAHGLQTAERELLYMEMNRIAKNLVIFHDYNGHRAILTDIIEWLERGDYFHFIKVAGDEMRRFFSTVRILDVSARAAWYVCTPHDVKDETNSASVTSNTRHKSG